MLLVTTVVLMMLIVVTIKSVELQGKKEAYLLREAELQEEIAAEKVRTEEIVPYSGIIVILFASFISICFLIHYAPPRFMSTLPRKWLASCLMWHRKHISIIR